jgi:hypothetical protein
MLDTCEYDCSSDGSDEAPGFRKEIGFSGWN